MKKFILYFRSRFPAGLIYIYSFISIWGIAEKAANTFNYINIVLYAFIYTSFFFHLRVLDEFKDFKFDNRHHKDRPIQSGKISLSQVRLMGLINFSAATASVVTLGNFRAIAVYYFTIAYTILMFKEFFIKNFYRKSPTLYLISHQIVLVPLHFYFFSSLSGRFWKFDTTSGLAVFLYSLIPTILIEIGRKMNYRLSSRGKKTPDTYYYIWGEQQTIAVFSALVGMSGFLGLYVTDFNRFFAIFLIVAAFFFWFLGKQFSSSVARLSLLITGVFVLTIPALLIL